MSTGGRELKKNIGLKKVIIATEQQCLIHRKIGDILLHSFLFILFGFYGLFKYM